MTPRDITHDSVLDAMSGLNERDLHLVQLRFWDQLTWGQIATRMGFACPTAAELHWHHNIRPALRAALETE